MYYYFFYKENRCSNFLQVHKIIKKSNILQQAVMNPKDAEVMVFDSCGIG